MTWLITGGAGYIGSHVVDIAKKRDFNIVVVDNLSHGKSNRIPANVPFLNTSIDDAAMHEFMLLHNVTGIVHLAALKNVGESEQIPDAYWDSNVVQLEKFLKVAIEAGVQHFVFSSSAAVYGQPDSDFITEQMPTVPINTYGKTKLAGERLLDKVTDMSRISLRYFNVAGASSRELADSELQNLIPIAIDKIEKDETVHIFGDTYPTKDGTCIRDYVHVQDIAEAHIAAMELVVKEKVENERVNLGTGSGASVFEVLRAIEAASGLTFKEVVDLPRTSDPARLVASPLFAKARLGWEASKSLAEIVQDAWRFRNPSHR